MIWAEFMMHQELIFLTVIKSIGSMSNLTYLSFLLELSGIDFIRPAIKLFFLQLAVPAQLKTSMYYHSTQLHYYTS